jgi:ABC-type branched-subunit amino acid transport system permease subunit
VILSALVFASVCTSAKASDTQQKDAILIGWAAPFTGLLVQFTQSINLYNFPGSSMFILGVISISIILIAPKGIMGTLHDKFGLGILSARRSLNDIR